MAKQKSKTVEQYSPFIAHPRPDAKPATEPEAKPEPAPEPVAKLEPEPDVMIDMARKLIAAVRARDEDVVAAVLKSVGAVGKGA